MTNSDFENAYTIKRTDRCIHIAFQHPMRTISNAVVGEGLQWIEQFCNFYVDRSYNCSQPRAELQEWLAELRIPGDRTAGMMTAVPMRDAAFVRDISEHYRLLVMATAGVGNAVDITSGLPPEAVRKPGTINVMVFLDGHLTDGALVNALLSATEAKTKALHELNVRDPRTGTVATGTSTDSLLVAATQRGEATPYAGSGTVVGKLIGRNVYQAVKQSLNHYVGVGNA